MAEGKLVAMRRVAAVRSAQRAIAERELQTATGTVAAAQAALAIAGQRVEEAFATWRTQADASCFQPRFERHHAAQLVVQTGARDTAHADCDAAGAALAVAQQALCRADAAVEQSAMIVLRLARRDRMRREERHLADHADRVTQRWGRT